MKRKGLSAFLCILASLYIGFILGGIGYVPRTDPEPRDGDSVGTVIAISGEESESLRITLQLSDESVKTFRILPETINIGSIPYGEVAVGDVVYILAEFFDWQPEVICVKLGMVYWTKPLSSYVPDRNLWDEPQEEVDGMKKNLNAVVIFLVCVFAGGCIGFCLGRANRVPQLPDHTITWEYYGTVTDIGPQYNGAPLITLELYDKRTKTLFLNSETLDLGSVHYKDLAVGDTIRLCVELFERRGGPNVCAVFSAERWTRPFPYET